MNKVEEPDQKRITQTVFTSKLVATDLNSSIKP
jgi:hypothetical protein